MSKRIYMALLCGLVLALMAPGIARAALPPDPNGWYVPYQPQLADDERGLLGLINDERAREGLAPLRAALPLTDAADRYANYVVSSSTQAQGHYAYGSPEDRMEAAGWPSSKRGEVMYGASQSPVDAFEWWMNDPPHRVILLDPDLQGVGIARRGKLWVVDLGVCPAGSEGSCQMTDDIGDASLATFPPDNPDDPPPENPGAGKPRVTRAEVKGSRLRLTFAVPSSATDVVLTVSQGSHHPTHQLAGTGSVRKTLRLSPGWWTLELSASGALQLCREVKVSAPPKDGQASWQKAKLRDC